MVQTENQPQGGPRDVKADIIEGLDDCVPALKGFFKTLTEPVLVGDSVLDFIRAAQATDGPERQWLFIDNLVVDELNSRYNALNSRYNALLEDNQNLGIQVAQLTEQLNNSQVTANSYKNLVESRGATERDGAMPHPAPFSGDDTNSTKRTQKFRTWRTRIEAR